MNLARPEQNLVFLVVMVHHHHHHRHRCRRTRGRRLQLTATDVDSLMHYDSGSDLTVLVLNNFKNGVYPYANIYEIVNNKPCSLEYAKKIDLAEQEIQQFVGEYTDPEDSTQKHLITYLDGHLVYNTDQLNWDMRFFPSAGNTFQAIRQGGTNGVMEFTPQTDGTMKLQMTQYGQVIGGGIRN